MKAKLSLIFVFLCVFLSVRIMPASASGDLKEIAATGPAECAPGQVTEEWSWSISNITSGSYAPASITVHWTDGNESVPFRNLNGSGVAKYTTQSHQGTSSYLGATAWIYAEWQGTFTISHPPCSSLETPTPGTTVIPDTSTPAATATETYPATPTWPPTSNPFDTPTPEITLTPKEVTATITPTVLATLPPPGSPKRTPALLPLTGESGHDGSGSELLFAAALLGGIGLLLVGIGRRKRS